MPVSAWSSKWGDSLSPWIAASLPMFKAGEVWVNGATRARSKLARLQPLSGIHFARYTLLSRFAESIVDDQELCCAGALQNSNVPGNEGEQEPKALTKRSPCAPF